MAVIRIKPNALAKLDVLAGAAKYDVCMASCNANGDTRGRVPDPVDPKHKWIYPAHLPGGARVPILKVLQTNACVNRCTYCQFSAASDIERRMGYQPQELADMFMQMARKRLVEGLFLSSGIGHHREKSMERMVKTADILRNRHKFKGYIHLKILPGAPFDLIEKATSLATRISVNLEAPTKEALADIAPDKTFAEDLVTRMKWAGKLIEQGAKTASQATQFVVGAANETDLDILRTTDWIYREFFVFRSYFSAFQKTNDKADLDTKGASLLREHRLYQSDYLLRGYGFRMPDLVFDERGNIPEQVDPKTAYAMMHPELFPIDINRADEQMLLKVPGIGPLSARRIMESRGKEPFHSIEELKGTGALIHRAAPYIEFSGKGVLQLHLFETPPPSRWKTGILPAGLEKTFVSPANPSEIPYLYPGQVDRPIQYSGFSKKGALYCR